MKTQNFAKLTLRQQVALIISMQVRNELEDFHHDHLDQDQMKELNQLTRKGIYDALGYIPPFAPKLDNAQMHELDILIIMIPDYWEIPGTPKTKLRSAGWNN